MKKAFIHVRERIIKNRKKLIYGVLALFIGQICFFGLGGIGVENAVYAATNTQSDQEQDQATKLYELFSLFSKIIYIVMYPLFMLAGKLVDNSLVYGEDFYFDTILWNLWVIVRNIANFALGFIFIFYIFKYLITKDSKHDPKWLIIRALIAGVGIQASWFIMAALIDVSTIITYGVGGLPITVLGTDDNSLKYNPYVLKTVVSIDGDNADSYHIYLSNPTGTSYISACETFDYFYTGDNNQKVTEELIFSPQMVYYQSGENECFPTQRDRCHVLNQVYKIVATHTHWEVSSSSSYSCTDFENLQHEVNEKIETLKTDYKERTREDIEGDINNGQLLRFGQIGDNFGLDEGNQMIGNEWGSHRIKDILSGSYVGVFGALYGSLLNAGADLRVTSTTSNGIYVKLLNTALSLGHMVAISIPLIAMFVVFMIRICVLWMAIALSPIIVLLKVFDFEKKIDGLKINFLKYIKVSNLIGIIFSPVIMCFAISMSTVLVRIISAENWEIIDGLNKPILGGLINLNIEGVGVNIGKMVVSVIGIAITRFLVWAAVKSSAIGESEIVKSLKNLANTTLGSIPIVPIPNFKDGGFSFVGMNAAKTLPDNISNNIKNKYGSDETLKDLLDPDRVSKRRDAQWQDVYKESIKTFTPSSANWTTQEIDIFGDGSHKKSFTALSASKKTEVINAINGLEEKNRTNFGNSAEEITFKGVDNKDVKYTFNQNTKQYEKKEG